MATRVIYKYELNDATTVTLTTLRMPLGAKILHVGVARQKACIWAAHDFSVKEKESRAFYVFLTGEVYDDRHFDHIGSFVLNQIDAGDFVGHVCEAK